MAPHASSLQTSTSVKLDQSKGMESHSVWSFIKRNVDIRPLSTAVSEGERSLTYQDLDTASAKLAAVFLDRGVRAGDTVPILLTRSLESVTAILALLRLGVCYVPMDADSWGEARINAVLRAIEPTRVILTADVSHKIDRSVLITAEEVKSAWNSSFNTAQTEIVGGSLDLHQDPDTWMYIIFTSGTTGQPKGVVIPHRCIVNYVQQGSDKGMPFNLGVTHSDRVLLLFSLAFDAAWGVFFSSLCHGCHLVLSEPRSVFEDVKSCTILPATPSLLSTLGDAHNYLNVRSIFLGGESPSPKLVQEWWSPKRRIFNCYGPTEATICTSMGEVRPGQKITLGEPMTDTHLFILNDQLEESHDGEIYISGPGLAVGYYKNEALTAERFIQWRGQRIYRTLDRGQKLPEGIIFCGREDSIVKNRGYLINIELDVVPLLLAYPQVTAAAAFMHKGKLIGCIAPKAVDVTEMRRWLSQGNDAFLVPDHIAAYQELPTSPNGKIDVAYLQRPFTNETEFDEDCFADGTRLTAVMGAIADTLGLPTSSISTSCSYWELGGNSLLAIKLVSGLRQRGLQVSFSDIYESRGLDQLAEKCVSVPSSGTTPIEAAPDFLAVDAPITTTQLGMIRSSIRKSATSYMLVSVSVPWAPDPDRNEKFRRAWKQVMLRHSVFHTTFDLLAGVQKPVEQRNFDWRERCVSAEDLDSAVEEESSLLLRTTNHQDEEGMFRPRNSFRLVSASEHSKAVLLWLVHHCLVDGWSMGLVVEEVQAILRGENLEYPPQFWQFAQLLSRHLEDAGGKGKKFWKDAMSRINDGVSLSLPKPVAPADGSHPGVTSLAIDLPLPRIEQTCRIAGVTSATMLYAAWALLLKSYTAQDDLVFGTVFSGRDFPLTEIDKIVGPLLNACPLPMSFAGLNTKESLLGYVCKAVHQVAEHQWTAAEALRDLTSGNHNSAFQTMLFLEYDLPGFTNSGWEFSRTDVPEFPLTVMIQRKYGGLCLKALFDQTMYTRPVIERMMKHFQNLFLALLDPGTVTIIEVCDRLLDPCEFLNLIHNSSSLMNPYFGPSNLKDVFEIGVRRWPDAVAVESTDRSITYRDIDLLTNYVSRAIADRTRPGDAVAVLSDRSFDWVVSVLAIVKAGAAYVPLDTKLPIERMKMIVDSTQAKICVFPNESCYNSFLDVCNEKFLLHELLSKPVKVQSPRLSTTINGEDIAYIIFTSGSTGTPKGVRIPHKSVVSYLSYKPARMDARPGRRHAQMFSPGFDVNLAEIFGTLCYGATLVLADPDNPFAHLSRVNGTMITPSFLSVCNPDDFPTLDTILFAGEAVPQILADRWATNRTVYNSYGPCECTIGCLFQPLQSGREVTLGRTIPRVGVYILDTRGRPVPIGVPGEICLTGIQVAEGYIGKGMEKLSGSRFVPDPFIRGYRMYRTGDRAVWTEDMEPRFLGRVDNQVKVRGFRIELEEVENAIRVVSPEVRRAAAIVSGNNIVAFVEPESVVVSRIQKALRAKLPSYTRPSSIVALHALPTTPNQKLDRKALQSHAIYTTTKGGKPLTRTQSMLATIWREILGQPADMNIDPEADFLLLGGNSLSQIRVAQKASQVYEFRFPLKLFIWNTTLSRLSEQIDDCLSSKKLSQVGDRSFKSSWRTIEPPFTEVSYLEEEFVRLSISSSSPQSFNVAYKVRLKGSVSLHSLNKAVLAVIAKEPILQSNYRMEKGRVKRSQSSVRCEVTAGEFCDAEVAKFVNRPFDLFAGPLTRVMLCQELGGVDIVLVQHHAITDKVAVQVLFRRIGATYAEIIQNRAAADHTGSIPPNMSDYRIWAEWKARQPSQVSGADATYWKGQLADLPRPIFEDSSQLISTGRSETFSFNPGNTSTRPMELYVMLVALAMAKVKRVTDMVLAIPHIDRTEPGTEDLLGVFLDILPLRVRMTEAASQSPLVLMRSLKTQIQDALTHSIPFRDIRCLIGEDQIFQVLVVYHRREDLVSSGLDLPGVRVEEMSLRAGGAKFPLLVEFTELETDILCELEYMEGLVTRDFVLALREAMQTIFPGL
ncbi:nonribosomal peptide synthetase 5 [Aspergillus udagawae]|nr:nonribosomal peptide synthetase 5 [Aspergillus udagawae]GFG16132.1 nonribosomal peptide synthetase 5 [Aspergillus udagawae]